jgi:hypothetical protein
VGRPRRVEAHADFRMPHQGDSVHKGAESP